MNFWYPEYNEILISIKIHIYSTSTVYQKYDFWYPEYVESLISINKKLPSTRAWMTIFRFFSSSLLCILTTSFSSFSLWALKFSAISCPLPKSVNQKTGLLLLGSYHKLKFCMLLFMTCFWIPCKYLSPLHMLLSIKL